MTDTLPCPEEFLPLTPAVFNILLLLADREKHGYGIMLEGEANTSGQVLMGPGTAHERLVVISGISFLGTGVLYPLWCPQLGRSILSKQDAHSLAA